MTVVPKGIHSFCGVAAFAVLAMFGPSMLPGASVQAANGQCKWEGGSGSPTYPSCNLEDCVNVGGRAQCREPVVTPDTSVPEAYTDDDKFTFRSCPGLASHHCVAQGGTWVGGNPACTGLPQGFAAGNSLQSTNEPTTLAAAENYFDFIANGCPRTPSTGTGWLTNIGYTGCWGGGPQYKNGKLIRAVQIRSTTVTCSGSNPTTSSIELLKHRNVACPPQYMSRTSSAGILQCFRPAPPCCENSKIEDISLLNGSFDQKETDYPPATTGGVSFGRSYTSGGNFRMSGDPSESMTPIDYWSHTYSNQVVATNNADMLAGVTQGGGMQFFNAAGAEVHNTNGAADRLQSLGSAGWKLDRGNGDVEYYDSNGSLQSLVSRSGVTQTLTYSSGRLSNVTDSFGRQLNFAYDTEGKMTSVTLPGGSSVVYGYDTSKRLSTVKSADDTIRTYHYENPNKTMLITGISDENGSRYETIGYDTAGRISSRSLAGGVKSFTISYGSLSLSATSVGATDALGINYGGDFSNQNGSYGFRTAYRGQAGTGPQVSSAFYDTNGNVSERRGFFNAQTNYVYLKKYSYDLSRNLEISRTEGLKTYSGSPISTPATRTITTQWHPTRRLPAEVTVYAGATATGTPRNRTNYAYDTSGNLLTRTVTDTTVTPNATRTWTYTYNSLGKVLTEDGPRTDVTDITTYTYYNCTTGGECGQLNTITSALGHVTTFNSYNAHGRPTQITDANGVVTSIAYDPRQRVTDRCVGGTLPGCTGGELAHFDYWPTGMLKKATNPDGSYVEYVYDAAHRLTEIKDGAFNRIVYTLDGQGNRTAENTYDPSNALRRTHTRVFNTYNQLWKDVNAAGTTAVTTTFAYDNNGNQRSVNAPLSRNVTNLYDELDRLTRITDPANGVTQFSYDADDNLTAVTDPRNLVTTYTYTGFGDLKTTLSPDTGLTTNTYDSGGNLDTSTDSREAVADYNYDVANRVTSVSFTKAGVTDQTINYGYDAGTNQKGRLTSAWDADHSLAWTYDTQGRVTGKGQTVGSTTLAIGYGYDGAGRLGNVTLPSGSVITFGYNTSGQVTNVTLNGSTTIISGITYDPFGPITGWTWGNGTFASRGFDTDGKITQVDNANGASLKNYSYDDAFRITGIGDAGNGALSWTYGYDLLDRLTSATSTSVSQGWTYDANGNRLTQTGTTPSSYSNSSSSNRVNSISGSLARTYGYDNAGNALGFGSATFTYNNRGRMVTASNGGITATYTYNALGQRIKRATASATAVYVYDEAGHLAGEYTAAGALVQETVWLGDTPIATLRQNGSGGVVLYYVHADHLDTPRLITDTSNNLRWRWDSDAFGTNAPSENPTGLGTFEYSLRFPGQQYDGVMGLHYNYFRDYDPAVGRYIESDPIGLNGGLNTYAYAYGQPIRFVDPSGLRPPGGAIDFKNFIRDEFFGGRFPDKDFRSDGMPWGWGCGDVGTDKFVPDGFFMASFYSACRRHDNCYGTCGKDKGQCDSQFLKDLLDSCDSEGYGVGCKGVARSYYAAMKTKLSRDAYNRAQEEACQDCKK
jgi:RHS repeat-associated protein